MSLYKGYNNTELTAVVAENPTLPAPLSDTQLLEVLYTCVDVEGDIVADSFCVAGCVSLGDGAVDDICAM